MIILRLEDIDGVDYFYENDEGHIYVYTFHGWKQSTDVPDRLWLEQYVETFEDATLTEIDVSEVLDMVDELREL